MGFKDLLATRTHWLLFKAQRQYLTYSFVGSIHVDSTNRSRLDIIIVTSHSCRCWYRMRMRMRMRMCMRICIVYWFAEEERRRCVVVILGQIMLTGVGWCVSSILIGGMIDADENFCWNVEISTWQHDVIVIFWSNFPKQGNFYSCGSFETYIGHSKRTSDARHHNVWGLYGLI
jgi:hypothetical protein